MSHYTNIWNTLTPEQIKVFKQVGGAEIDRMREKFFKELDGQKFQALSSEDEQFQFMELDRDGMIEALAEASTAFSDKHEQGITIVCCDDATANKLKAACGLDDSHIAIVGNMPPCLDLDLARVPSRQLHGKQPNPLHGRSNKSDRKRNRADRWR